MTEAPGPETLAAFPLGEVDHVERVTDGLVNATYRVSAAGGTFILQRLSPIVESSITGDIESVTEHLASKGVPTFRVVRTNAGEVCANTEGGRWRLITYLPGTTVRKDATLPQLVSAGQLVARFHEAMLDYSRPLVGIPGFHDTPAILAKLGPYLEMLSADERAQIAPLATKVLGSYDAMPHTLSSLPLRVAHGDLKISNIRFDESGEAAIAVIDLDTVGRYSLPIEIGDMLRSWCKSEEGGKVRFVPERWEAAFKGYAPSFVLPEERAAFEEGFLQITLELAARFLIDAKEQVVFAFDPAHHASLFDQNRYRAEKMLELHDDFLAKRAGLARYT